MPQAPTQPATDTHSRGTPVPSELYFNTQAVAIGVLSSLEHPGRVDLARPRFRPPGNVSDLNMQRACREYLVRGDEVAASTFHGIEVELKVLHLR